MRTAAVVSLVALIASALVGCGAGEEAPPAQIGAAALAATPTTPPISEELRQVESQVRANPAGGVGPVDAYLAAHPDDPRGHLALTLAAREVLPVGRTLNADQVALLERAAASAKRVPTMTQDRELRIAALLALADINGPMWLKRPADLLDPARETIALGHNGTMEHRTLVIALRELNRTDEAIEVLLRARTVINIREHRGLATIIGQFVDDVPTLTKAQVQTLVTELNEIAAADPDGAGPRAKTVALTIQADRLEAGSAQQRVLREEAALWEKISDEQSAAVMADLKAKLQILEQRRAGAKP